MAWARKVLLSNELNLGELRPKEGRKPELEPRAAIAKPVAAQANPAKPAAAKPAAKWGDEEPEDRVPADDLEFEKSSVCRCCNSAGSQSTQLWSLGPRVKQGSWSLFSCGTSEPTDAEVEKMVKAAECAVILNVYGLANPEVARSLQPATRKFLSTATALHVAVEVLGTEWSYGAAGGDELGIFYHEPRRCLKHRFAQAIYLGDCKKRPQEICAILMKMKPEWPAKVYDIFSKSSWHFAMAFVHKLGVGTLPSGLNRLGRQGPISAEVKAELHSSQQIPSEYRNSFQKGMAKLSEI